MASVITTKALGTTEVVTMKRYGDGMIELVSTVVTTGNRTSGSAVLAAVVSTNGIRVGDPISGTGIPADTTVLSFVTNTSITMSANATSGSATSTSLTINKTPGKRLRLVTDSTGFAKKLFDALNVVA